ncbi:hypothetical protein PILCRDRAFT_15911 [Piloderma croceum F 1598]|uniref:Myb/SANT-like domain-containing protein n=1 Tax=Piloderma croceum (strain F 1598) TaxID=765440 RepID=A0A0C3EY84_PILCF|nr:hypothetical protein PILCRDRAFT_15911 [Piloderma croceum F 1598]
MATSGQQEKANWNDPETAAFIEYLWEHRSEGGNGGTFKDVTMRAAAEHIADKHDLGPIKLLKDNTSGMHWDNTRGANIEGEAATSAFDNYINASKGNKLMAPFRTKGWTYFEKFQDLIPNASARGSHTFSAMHMAPPNALDRSIDMDGLEILGVSEANPPLVSGSGAAADTSGNNDKNINDSLMDIDIDNKSSTAVSASSGKRKLSTSASLGAFPFPEPAMKKNSITSSSVGSSSKSFPQTPSGPPSSEALSSSKAPSSSKAGRPSRRVPSSSKNTSSKLSPILLVHEMQGTINSLAGAVRDAGATDPVAKLRQEAIQQVSQLNDDLSASDKLLLVKLFARDYAAVQTYVALVKFDDLRKDWLSETIEEQ